MFLAHERHSTNARFLLWPPNVLFFGPVTVHKIPTTGPVPFRIKALA